MKLQYNAPVTLTFAILATIILILSSILGDGFTQYFVVGPQMYLSSPTTYFRIFSYVLGHANWQHWMGNATLLLLLGPIVEEKYGSKDMLFMIFVTAIVTGIIQTLFFPGGLIGASGIVFMLILLSSITNFKSGTIPLTFILVTIIFIGQEIVNILSLDNISQFAHIMGGACGAAFGFLARPKDTFKSSIR